MSYYKNDCSVTCFRPADDENTIFLEGERSLKDVLEVITEKWPGISMAQIIIEPAHIHTHAIGYDLYDASDYDVYVVIHRKQQ